MARRALLDIMKGPVFWEENADLIAVRIELNAHWIDERMHPISLEEKSRAEEPTRSPETIFNRVIRDLTVNGHFLPVFRREKKTVYQNKSFCGNFNEIFGFEHVLYEDPMTKTGYIVSRNPGRYVSEFAFFLETSIKFKSNFESLLVKYNEKLPYLTSQIFWRDIYTPELINRISEGNQIIG